MIVECGHCGAPLDINEGATVVSCAYCAKKNRVAGLKTIAPTTPSDFKAPAVWKPTETSDPLAYHIPAKPRRWQALGVVAAIGAVIGGISYAIHMQGATVEEIAKLPLDSTPDRIEKDLHVTYKTDDALRVTFRSGAAGPYEHLFISWDEKDFSLPSQLSLFVIEGSVIGPDVLSTLEKSLHGGVDEGGSWRWGPASLHVDRKSGTIQVSVSATDEKQPNLLRKRQLTALWQIARAAAFGGPLPPREEVVAVLGGGYPMAKVGAFDLSTPFGAARSAVPTMFPGSLLSDSSTFRIALDHPLLRALQLRWNNAADGSVAGAHFDVAPAFRSHVGGLVACLSKELGAPETHVDNFAEGMQSSIFQVRGGADLASTVTMHVGDQANLYINPRSAAFDQAAWQRAFQALDHCR